jgi:hypothetical protein
VGVNARNAALAARIAQMMQMRGKVTGGPGPVPVGGLLDEEKILGVEDLPPIEQPSWGPLSKSMLPALFGRVQDGVYGPRRSTIQNLTGAFNNSFYSNPRYGTPGFSTGLGGYGGGGGYSEHYKNGSGQGNNGSGSTHYQNGSTHYKTAF